MKKMPTLQFYKDKSLPESAAIIQKILAPTVSVAAGITRTLCVHYN